MTKTIQWGKVTLLLHDPVFQEGYETGRATCLEALSDCSSRSTITDYSLQTLFVSSFLEVPFDCASPLSWQLGYYLGYVSSPVLSEEGSVCSLSNSISLTEMIHATA
jgi:hypothetical protein